MTSAPVGAGSVAKAGGIAPALNNLQFTDEDLAGFERVHAAEGSSDR
jgi:hypothetical protein